MVEGIDYSTKSDPSSKNESSKNHDPRNPLNAVVVACVDMGMWIKTKRRDHHEIVTRMPDFLKSFS